MKERMCQEIYRKDFVCAEKADCKSRDGIFCRRELCEALRNHGRVRQGRVRPLVKKGGYGGRECSA
jgi:hypothetical protein